MIAMWGRQYHVCNETCGVAGKGEADAPHSYRMASIGFSFDALLAG